MQDHDWNALKHALALYRTGTYADAARATGTNETTVARRIRALETALGTPVFVRGEGARHVATDFGLTLLARAEQVEQLNAQLRAAAGTARQQLAGTVRISAVPLLINRVLLPHLAGLRAAHPGLGVELSPDPANVDLTRREADLALRFGRPTLGGLQTRTVRLGALRFDVFGPARLDPHLEIPWIGHDDAHAGLPQARWMQAVLRGDPAARPALRVSDAHTALEAVAAGLGKTLLPTAIGLADDRLRRVSRNGLPPPPARDVWLLFHSDAMARPSVRAARDWIAALEWEAR